ncbi:MAG: hypothetical protein ACO1SV_12185 [Fimbriimonas sp.]
MADGAMGEMIVVAVLGALVIFLYFLLYAGYAVAMVIARRSIPVRIFLTLVALALTPVPYRMGHRWYDGYVADSIELERARLGEEPEARVRY